MNLLEYIYRNDIQLKRIITTDYGKAYIYLEETKIFRLFSWRRYTYKVVPSPVDIEKLNSQVDEYINEHPI